MTSPDEGPEWADEAHLDEVFSTWVPGPPDSASAAEREMAGDNPQIEIPAEDSISEEDMEAALAAALAETEGATGPQPEPMELEADPVDTMDTMDPMDPMDPADLADAVEGGPVSPPVKRSEPASPSWLQVPTREDRPEPVVEPEPVAEPEPVVEPAPRADADHRTFEPAAAPPPEPTRVARPWTRSDDDILPGRKGKGRRR